MSFSLNSRAVVIATSLAAVLLVVACASTERNLAEDRVGYASPESAVQALIAALEGDDVASLRSCLGAECDDLLDSGDEIDDRAARADFVSRYRSANRIEMVDADTAVLHVGPEDWPLPIPIVRQDGVWFLDTEEGREEILDRRIGRHELCAIQVCLAVADAQGEYARRDWDGDGVFVYAQKLRSSPGKKDGLYWETAAGQAPSPAGEFVAAAEAEGYDATAPEGSRPYHGYFYRLLRSQGSHAEGGAYEYMVGGKMIGGFAVIAWPANYGNSGVKSFLVNHDGVVYEKDLGDDTAAAAAELESFDPDSSWTRVSEEDTAPLED